MECPNQLAAYVHGFSRLRSVIKLFRIEQVFQLFLTPAGSGEGFSDFRRSFRLALPNRIFKMTANKPVLRDQSGAPRKRLSHNESVKWISGPLLLQRSDGDLRKRQVADG
jgi:hypothetical protein